MNRRGFIVSLALAPAIPVAIKLSHVEPVFDLASEMERVWREVIRSPAPTYIICGSAFYRVAHSGRSGNEEPFWGQTP